MSYIKETLIVLWKIIEKDRQITHFERNGTLTTLASLLQSLSKKKGIGHIFANLDDDYYIIKFYKEENLRRILQGP